MYGRIINRNELPDHAEERLHIGTTFRAAGARLVVFEHRNSDVVALFHSRNEDILAAGEAERTERNVLTNTLRNFFTGQCDLQFILAMSAIAKRRITNRLERKCPLWILKRTLVLVRDEFDRHAVLNSLQTLNEQRADQETES